MTADEDLKAQGAADAPGMRKRRAEAVETTQTWAVSTAFAEPFLT
ncbi:MAG TPA: hypothetical protein VIA62_28360 [Thermoanaerobaculia bacterium]|jgi:hypothetical protein|nr:hypothetical protein [Thermoanaerobaculia bacterium]